MKKNEVDLTRIIFNAIKKYELNNQEAMGVLVSVVRSLIIITKKLELEVKDIDVNELLAQLDIE
jgi:hypothetical protein